jgi:hypothetical protein
MPTVRKEYLVGYLNEIGPTIIEPGGLRSITNTDIVGWQKLNGVVLDPWEAHALIKMSSNFLSYKNNRNPLEPNPMDA